MICRSNSVVSVYLNAFDSILVIKLMILLHQPEYLLIVRHLFLSWEKSLDSLLLDYFKPWMQSYLVYGNSSVWVRIQNLS